MFYGIFVHFFHFLIRLVSGKVEVEGLENLPPEDGEKFVLVAPHRTFLDPVFIAIASYPRRFMYMAKKELFENKLLGWCIKQMNAFPIDRDNPSISAIKRPIEKLKLNELGLVIFPSGSRHSTDIKAGAVTIARLSKRPIVPAVYSGPTTIGGLFKRKRTTVKYGKPFYVERKIDGVDDINAYYSEKIQQAFEMLDEN